MRKAPLYALVEKSKFIFSTLDKVFNPRPHQFPRAHKRLVAILILSIMILMLLPTDQAPSDNDNTTIRKTISLTIKPTENTANENATAVLSEPKVAIVEPDSIDGSWQYYPISKGDSVYRIFRQYHISATTLHRLIALDPKTQAVTKIKPGEKMAFYISNTHQLIQLRISGDERDNVYALREDGSYLQIN